MAAGKNENKEKKKVNGGRESCGSGKGVCGNFYFYFFSLEVGNDGAEMAVVCGDDALSLGNI